jgi:hypothetical protein
MDFPGMKKQYMLVRNYLTLYCIMKCEHEIHQNLCSIHVVNFSY